ALLIEVIKADHDLDERETNKFLDVLKDSYNIPQAELQNLKTLAEAESRQATSLYQFTKLINEHYDYEEKVALIGNMWKIAFSDEEIDRYEDHLIRKISELIYVSHSDFIRSKHNARGTAENDS
ncbi:MAG: TerB family tellurite resistance protein, partial [Gimesia chilikensis]